ncbi:serine/threonine protein kinase [Beutenbergia cavernae DSM 12333]|uniref:non-specific serine/threonine protein kinase n=1 Tax=Beutenbergia cavernae (strain ATCC BAA-8 / DSM 12333 / CCUG 43141 / JCM 11478 / NBRC 16432 / NCIMB 13614 / HKI 0122) TaxID=471853 RepID=C5C4Y8_BEUC1|nr:protein kinase [Beutenbergia cavernae]ACQ80116.1 serine/threonine protein kinase [Beutenbergia cavernae DSM 12333]
MQHTRRAPQVPGYRLGDPLGFGADGPVWAGRPVAVPDGDPVAVRLVRLDPSLVEPYRARVGGLRGLDHPHLGGVADVVAVDERTTAVVGPPVPGPTLAALRAARAPLGEREVRTLVGQVASALAHLHAQGVVHGDVSPANVVAAERGWVLIDVAGFAPTEGGTVGFVAPERRTGRPASAAGDVWSLAALAAFCAEDVPPEVERALAEDPASRPAAAELAALDAAEEPRLPAGDVLAQASLRAAALAAPTTRLGGRVRASRRRRTRSGRGVRVASAGRAGTRSGRRAARHGAPSPRRRALMAAVAASAVLVGVALGGVVAAERPERAGGAPLGPVVRELLAARDAALTAGDLDALHAISAPGSPARAQDDELWARTRGSGTRLEGLRTEVLGVEAADDDEVLVRVRQLPHVRVTPEGRRTVPAQGERCVRLRVEQGVDGARLADVGICS